MHVAQILIPESQVERVNELFSIDSNVWPSVIEWVSTHVKLKVRERRYLLEKQNSTIEKIARIEYRREDLKEVVKKMFSHMSH